MLVQFVSRHYSDKLGNPSEKQVGMKRLLILGFTAGNTKTVFEVVDGFLNIHSDFVGGIPFGRTADRTGIGAQVFLGINIKHPAAGGIQYRNFHSGRHVCFYRLFYRIPISFLGIQTSWSAARSGDGICFLRVSLEETGL